MARSVQTAVTSTLLGVLVGCVSAPGENGAAGAAGTSCTVKDSADGTGKVIACTDGTEVVLTNGKDGDPGTPGENGKDGDPGATGNTGATGPAGANGADGKDGAACTVEDGTAGSKTITCGTTVVTVTDGSPGADGTSCGITDNGDGTKTIDCGGTKVTITDGAAGVNGEDGKPCSVKENGNGTKTITCADGTVVTVANGKDGEDGTNIRISNFHGTEYLESSGAFDTAGKYYAKAAITGATADVDGKVTIDFTVADPGDQPVSGLTTVNANIAKLVPGTVEEPTSKWVAYIYRTQTVSGSATGDWPNPDGTKAFQANRESNGTLTDHGDGSYTYVFATNLTTAKLDNVAIPYERSRLHRVSIMLGGSAGATADATYDFMPDGSALATTRNIVPTAACTSCHGREFHGHGGDRLSVENCVTCHAPGNLDPNGGETIDFTAMVHKIHAGGTLPSIPGADGIVFDNPATPVDESADNGTYAIWGFGNTKHTWWKASFPAETANCTKCHTLAGQPAADFKQVDNWKTVPSRAACGSCHDDVDFAAGINHPFPQQNDAACAGCHTPSGSKDSIVNAHEFDKRDERNIPEFDVALTVSTPLNGTHFVKGEAPVVTMVLKENGTPIDHTTVVEDSAAEGCKQGLPCPARDGKFRAASLFVSGPRATRRPVLTTAARARVLSSGAGPFDISAANASLVLKFDGGYDVLSGDVFGSAVGKSLVTVTVPATGSFADKAAATVGELEAWLNGNAAFKARGIASVEGGLLVVRSRNLGSFFAVQLQASEVATKVFGGDLTVHTTTGSTPSNNVAKRTNAANDDPKAVRTTGSITYTLDPVDDLPAGTYVVYAEIADRGRVDAVDYKTPSVGVARFQVGTPTEELPIARNCNQCHQNESGKGFVLDYSRHNKIFDDLAVDRCGSCHDYVSQTGVGTDFAGAKNIARRVHAVHFGAQLNYPNTTVAYNDPVAGRNWDITFPQDVRNCEVCHSKGTTSGTWKTNPGRFACGGCHDSDEASAHLKLQTFDPTPADPWSGDEVESCATCHADKQ